MKKCFQLLALQTGRLLFFSLLLLFAVNKTAAQDSSQTALEFTVGAFLSRSPSQEVLNTFDSSGMNAVNWRAYTFTKSFLSNYKVMAYNQEGQTDWINHYATGLYSKWEAEQNQTVDSLIGIKHKYGQDTTWHDTLAWSTLGLTSPVDSLVYGPHYRREKEYKRWLYGPNLKYNVRYNMALDYDPQSVDPSEQVCVIKVVYRYGEIYNTPPPPYDSVKVYDTVFVQDTLTVSDFNPDGSFKFFKMPKTYQYPSKFSSDQPEGKLELPAPDVDTTYTDANGDNGIQFFVEWLGVGTLYIDYIEVYDNFGWNDYINPAKHDSVITNIQSYAQSYSNWPNIIYWFGHDEPYSIDAFIPMHIVDSLLKAAYAPRLITEFYPPWLLINNDSLLVSFYNIAKPEKLMIDFYPFTPSGKTLAERLEVTRKRFTEAHSLQPGFWYVGQGFGRKKPDGSWLDWRLPDSTELKATVMLALAHGIKGLMFWNYDSYQQSSAYIQGIVNEDTSKTELWYVIKDNFAPRLKGTLGTTLLGLDYTGNFLQLKYFIPTDDPPPQPVVYDYLTLGVIPSANDQNWHAGFFERPNYSDDKYFFLANLWGESAKTVYVKVTPSAPGYVNYRFSNVEEGYFDTTFTTQITMPLTHSQGEGYLYEVAPVIKYGGRLIYDETVADGTTLLDDMTIENGATLTVNGNYDVRANITVKDGGKIVTGTNGKLTFRLGKQLIVEGSAEIKGTPSNKLTIDFVEPVSSNGISVRENSSLQLSNCIIKNASTGLAVKGTFDSLDVEYVDFVDCDIYSVNIMGPSTSTPVIKNCVISNSHYGISATNLSEIVIQYDSVSNTWLGVYLSNVTNGTLVSNSIVSTTETLQGILLLSCNGTIRGNTISGHTNGIQLGNSSPDIGDNLIYDNSS